MQYVNANLLHAGDRNFVFPLREIPVAEVVLLRLIHGPDSVVDIQPLGKDTKSLAQTREMLLQKYGDANPSRAQMIDRMFANVHMQGLTKFSDIVQGASDDEPKAAKGAARGVTADEMASA